MITYQIQPSNLVPEGTTDPYGRYQVILQGDTPITVGTTINTITNNLKLGQSVTLIDSEGVTIGQLLPSITGGFTLATSPTPIPTQVNIGFRPTKTFLAATRFETSFSRTETTFRQPAVTTFTSWTENTTYPAQYLVNAGQGVTVIIEGSNLKLDPNDLIATMTIGSNVLTDITSPTNVINWTDKRIEYQSKFSISPPVASSGTYMLSSGDRSISFTLNVTDMT